MKPWAKALFDPNRIAVVGASAKQGKAGHVAMSNLLSPASGFAGEIVPVHPGRQRDHGPPGPIPGLRTFQAMSILP